MSEVDTYIKENAEVHQFAAEVLRLIDIQLATVPDNPIEESYKARMLANYVQALNGLLTAQKSYKEETNE